MSDKQNVLLIGGELDGRRVILPAEDTCFRAAFAPQIILNSLNPDEQAQSKVIHYDLHPLVAVFPMMGPDGDAIPFTLGVPFGGNPLDAFRSIIEVYSNSVQVKHQENREKNAHINNTDKELN